MEAFLLRAVIHIPAVLLYERTIKPIKTSCTAPPPVPPPLATSTLSLNCRQLFST